MAALGTLIGRGVLAARPAAGTTGALYYATDTSTLYRDSGSAWESVEGAGGFVSPMIAGGDMIYGDPAVPANEATVARGASASASMGANNVASLIDENDATQAASTTSTMAGQMYIVNLGVARTIDRFRVYQSTVGNRASAFVVESSTDNINWTTRHTISSLVSDTGATVLSSGVVTARYWRIRCTTGENSGNGWNVNTFEVLSTTGVAGTAMRLAKGLDGKVLLLAAGIPSWGAALKRITAQTIGTTQAAIAHGLSYMPTIVIPGMTSAGQIWRSAASDATNVYLTADAAGRTCDLYVG